MEAEHTAECAEIGALIELTSAPLRAAQGRGDLPHYLGVAARALTLAHSEAHRTCVTHDAMGIGRPRSGGPPYNAQGIPM